MKTLMHSGTAGRHLRAALVAAGVILAVSLVAWAQSQPNYDGGEPTYSGGAPAYDSTVEPVMPLTSQALSSLSRLQHIRTVVDRVPDLTPTRRAVALAEIDLAIYTLQNSNAPDAEASGESHPIYPSGNPAYNSGPAYDNTLPPQPAVPFDRKSAAIALRQLRTVIDRSSALDDSSRKRTMAAIDAAAAELDGGR